MLYWLPWNWKYRPIKMADGSTLRQVPEESPRKNWDVWADQEWARWERGQFGFIGGGCPGCYYARSVDVCIHAGRNPGINRAAVRRWNRATKLARIKAQAAGPCRCGGGTGPMVLGPGESFTFQVGPDSGELP